MQLIEVSRQLSLGAGAADLHTLSFGPTNVSLHLRTVERLVDAVWIAVQGARVEHCTNIGVHVRTSDLGVNRHFCDVHLSTKRLQLTHQVNRSLCGRRQWRTEIRERKRDPT